MTTITLQNEELFERIERLARRNNVSLESQVEELLASSVEHQEQARSRADIVRGIAAMTPQGVAQTDSVLLLREDRDL